MNFSKMRTVRAALLLFAFATFHLGPIQAEAKEKTIRIKTDNVEVNPSGVVLKTRKPNQSDETVKVSKDGKIILKQGQGDAAYQIELDQTNGGVKVDTKAVEFEY